MPDDPAYRARQQAHAQKIKMERTVMDMTGLPRGTIRRLQSFANRIGTQKAKLPPPPIPAAPQIKRAETSIKGAPLISAEKQSVSTATQSTATVDTLIVFDGFIYNFKAVGTLGSQVTP